METPRKRSIAASSLDENETSRSHGDETGRSLPPELHSVDFTSRVSWGKYQPTQETTRVPVEDQDEPVILESESPALCCHVHAVCGRARATTLYLKKQPGQENKSERSIPTPIFMPVGTKGCLKGVAISDLVNDPALSCPIILANTYHLAIQPGTELVKDMGGLHAFQGLPSTSSENSYNLLTDSGGFQMVSLAKLSEVSEDGVSFENPFTKQGNPPKEKDILLLRPEDSMRYQNDISANIIMALDDVVSR